MRVAGADVRLFTVPLGAKVAGVHGGTASIRFVTLEVHTDEGLAGSSYGWARDDLAAELIAAAARGAARIVDGDDATLIGAAWKKMHRHLAFVGVRGLARIGLSLVDMALWDLKCRSLELPLWRVLGGDKELAPMYSSALIATDVDGRSDTGAIAERASELADLGFRQLKMRFGLRSPDVDAKRLRDTVAAVAGIERWAVDANNRWDLQDSMRACDLLRDVPMLWFEDPGPRDDYAALRTITRATAIPICSGENLYHPEEAEATIDAGCRYVSLDLQRCGGITGWNALAALADARGIQVTPHGYGGIGAQLVCATANCPIGEHHPWFEDAFVEQLAPRDGAVVPSSAPGIGATLDPERTGPPVERARVP